MSRFKRALFAVVCTIPLLLTGPAHGAPQSELQVAISLDIPPYVMDQAAGGLEVDIVRQALEDFELRFVQLSYEELQSAIVENRADVSVGVQAADDDGSYFSEDFITFVNYAISKKSAGLEVDGVIDLADHQVLTWENAWQELGDDFEALFAPQSPQRHNYVEVADQEEQVRMFWTGDNRVVVIDYSIFAFFSKAMGHTMDEVDLHAIFPPVTSFKAGFRDVAVRDRFNSGLAALCREGEYDRLLQHYDMVPEQSVCE